ncbi:uncharacterized protein BDZ99DRAFT_88219 [Mytilinidion resinicola]|uniref:Uncharacterized protein n=1 Tax=Mytilinidion resinicola TaxID=574789 RepID=A0A6A6YED4_9PEZI|nr:uncharacterized protein BDZ99DRAFT_88219 [Mytilinidion resinicola]KAF2806928.1 hypothetical protein BDZ99DRAFT_88219 [Mytilinidion resinicola]
MQTPWRSAESMHWQLGEQEMNARANAPIFQLHHSTTSIPSPPPSCTATAQVSEGDLSSGRGARTAPVLKTGQKRDRESVDFVEELYLRNKRKIEMALTY